MNQLINSQALSEKQSSNKRRWIGAVLKIGISAGLLALLISGLDLDMMRATIERISPIDAALFFATWSVVALLGAWKWQILLKAWGIEHVYLNLVKWIMIGFFFNNLLPTGFGGDLTRLYTSGRDSEQTPGALAVLFYDRLFAFSAFVFLGIIALFFQFHFEKNAVLWLLYAGVIVVLLVLFWGISMPYLGNWYSRLAMRFRLLQRIDLTRWLKSLQLPSHQQKRLLYAFGVGIAMQLAIILAHFIVSEALELSIGLTSIFVFVPLLYVAVALPISVNGVGVREAVFVYFFQQSDIPQSEAVTFSLTYFSLFLLFSAAGGMIYILGTVETKNNNEYPNQSDVL